MISNIDKTVNDIRPNKLFKSLCLPTYCRIIDVKKFFIRFMFLIFFYINKKNFNFNPKRGITWLVGR